MTEKNPVLRTKKISNSNLKALECKNSTTSIKSTFEILKMFCLRNFSRKISHQKYIREVLSRDMAFGKIVKHRGGGNPQPQIIPPKYPPHV